MPGDDRVWKKIMQHAAMKTPEAQESHVKVGVLANPQGLERREGGISMIELAAIHEFGSPAAGIPERSFIRRTMKEKESEISRACVAVAKQFISGEVDLEKGLNRLGAIASTMIKNRITGGEYIPPPLKPATIKRKGSDRPLVDTGRLVGSITWKVFMGRQK